MNGELTTRALLVGAVIGAALAAANVYTGLQTGIIESGGVTAVVVTFALFRALWRGSTPLECNISQTVASSAAMMAITAGVIGPLPAMAMDGHAVPWWLPGVWGAALGLVACLVAIPLRARFVEDESLPFPSSVAVKELIVGLHRGDDRGGARVLLIAGAAACAFTLLRDVIGWIPGYWIAPFLISGIPAAQLTLGVSVSPLLVAAGWLMGMRVALSLLAGGVLAWAVLAPWLVRTGAVASAGYVDLMGWLVWPGAALMVSSAFTVLALGRRTLWHGLRWAHLVSPRGGRGRAAALAGLLLAAAVAVTTQIAFGVPAWLTGLALLLAVVLVPASIQATGETDTTPAGPLGGLTQLVGGVAAPGGTEAPLSTGGIVSGVTMHGAQMVSAWKTGSLLGAKPERQLIAQACGVIVGAAAVTITYVLVTGAYGLGSERLPAPAAQSWQATAQVVKHGLAGLPAHAPMAALVGAALGVLLTLAERRTRSGALPSPVALGVGFLIPFMIMIPMTLGGLLAGLVARRAPQWFEARGPALASGVLTGEALTAVVLSALALAGWIELAF